MFISKKKHEKIVQELSDTISKSYQTIMDKDEELKRLKAENQKLQEKADHLEHVKKEDSAITISFDKELKVNVFTKINKDQIAPTLVDEGYIRGADMENEDAIHIAMILLANEATSQIVDQYAGQLVEDDEEGFTLMDEEDDS